MVGLAALPGLVAKTGLSVLSFLQHLGLTQALDGNRSHSDLPFFRVSLSLDTVAVGDEDELEEDVGTMTLLS